MGGQIGKWFKMPTLAERLRAAGVREDVIQTAERTVFGRQCDRDLPALGAVLRSDEVAVQLLEASLNKSIGLLVLTSRRLVFRPKRTDATTTVIELTDITRTAARVHRGLGVLEVETKDGAVVVDKILGNQAETMSGAIQRARQPPADGPATHRDPLEELAELRALHHAGAIDEAEFQARKHQLFGQI